MTSVQIFDRLCQRFAIKRSTYIAKHVRRNREIRAREVRLIDADGNQLGVVSINEALKRAQDDELDLIEVSPNANPPVAKIVDWGKYQYEQAKQLKKSKTKQPEIKQIRFGLKIGSHDLEVKLKKIRIFLEAGHKVKVSVFFRGREMAHRELGQELLDKVLGMLQPLALLDQKAQFSGRYLTMSIRRNPNAKDENPQGNSQES